MYDDVFSGKNENLDDSSRELTGPQTRDLEEGWRVVEDDGLHRISGWNDEASFEQDTTPRVIKRRRRIRKRKQRPQYNPTPEIDLDSDLPVTYEPIRRKIRPQRLDEGNDWWLNMSDDMMDEPHNRRRTSPRFPEDNIDKGLDTRDHPPIEHFDVDDVSNMKIATNSPKFYQKVRDPFTALEEDAKIKKRRKGPSDIKDLLKKTGSVSLSEVLQKKNLSLTDLLMGKEQAISALTDTSSTDSETTIKEYKNPVEDDFPLFPQKFENKKEKINESTAEFEREKIEEIGLQKIATTLHPLLVKDQKKHTNVHKSKVTLPSTNAQLSNHIKKKSNQQSKHRVNNKQHETQEMSTTNNARTTGSTSEGPFRMSININSFSKVTDFNETEMDLPKKLNPYSAKEEIMEMMNDPESKRRLSRILEVRNMTVEELIDMRERGSSKKHLADLFHNQNKEPEPPQDVLEGHVPKLDKKDPFLFHDRKPRVLEAEERIPINRNFLKMLHISTDTSKTIESKNSLSNDFTTTTFPMIRINKNVSSEIENDNKLWAKILSELDTGSDEPRSSDPKFIEDILQNDVRRIDAGPTELNEPLQIHLDQSYIEANKMKTNESGISSAILTSLSVVGVSMFVFLTLLFMFKLSRRRRRSRNLISHFTEYKSKHPILQSSLRKTINLFVPHTPPKKVRDPVNCKNQTLDREWEGKPYESLTSA